MIDLSKIPLDHNWAWWQQDAGYSSIAVFTGKASVCPPTREQSYAICQNQSEARRLVAELRECIRVRQILLGITA